MMITSRRAASILLTVSSGALLLAAFLISGLAITARAQTEPLLAANQAQLVINELMAENDTVFTDPDEPGETPDWLELYNPTNQAVSLDGLVLKNGEGADEITFAITDGLSIPAQGFVLFIADDDPSQGPFHTNFRLNKDGDFVGLFGGVDGTVEIDSRRFEEQQADISEGRTIDGGPGWGVLDRPTPGRTNTPTAPIIETVTRSRPIPTATESVTVTAVISDDGTVVSANLVYSAANGSWVTVPMSSVDARIFRGAIPPQPDGAFVTYYVEATDNDGQSTTRRSDSLLPFGYQVGYQPPLLRINELMAINENILEDPDDPGDFADWFELYNPGSRPVALDGLYLSDDERFPTRFPIPSGLSIPAGGYLVFLADDDPEQGPTHTNFRLNGGGEELALYGARGVVIIDRIVFEDQTKNLSLGRYPDGVPDTWQILVCATPGLPNLLCDQKSILPLVLNR